MRFRHLTPADYRVMAWANGRGQTVELIRLEDDGGRLRLRLSIADVTEAGAFSVLPGIDRVLTLIEGDGFDLDFGGAAAACTALPLQPIAFAGDWSTSAVNLRGASQDFNVMTPHGRDQVTVERLPAGLSAWPASDNRADADAAADALTAIYVVRGTALVDTLGLRLTAGDLLLVEAAAALAVDVGGTVLAVRLDPQKSSA